MAMVDRMFEGREQEKMKRENEEWLAERDRLLNP
jgi:hypothetical protein